jgi:hypothetical protein
VRKEVSAEYKLHDPDLFYESFVRYTSFKQQVSCADVVYASSALLELCSDVRSVNLTDSFNDAYDCLGSSKNSELVFSKGVKIALKIQKAIIQKASIMLERHDIKTLKRIRYAYITRQSVAGISDHRSRTRTSNSDLDMGADNLFERPMVLSRLGRFIMDVKIANGSWKGKSLLPMLILSEKAESYIVVVIYPKASELDDPVAYKVYTKFRMLFTMAAKEGKFETNLNIESFDMNIAEVGKDYKDLLLGNLDHLLKQAFKNF